MDDCENPPFQHRLTSCCVHLHGSMWDSGLPFFSRPYCFPSCFHFGRVFNNSDGFLFPLPVGLMFSSVYSVLLWAAQVLAKPTAQSVRHAKDILISCFKKIHALDSLELVTEWLIHALTPHLLMSAMHKYIECLPLSFGSDRDALDIKAACLLFKICFTFPADTYSLKITGNKRTV